MSFLFRDALRGTRFYPLTDRAISGLSHAEQVSTLAQAGVSVVQLREKTLSPRQFYEEALAAVNVARANDLTIIINDRVDIALALKTGVHLGQYDLHPEAARSLLGDEAIIGFSTHSWQQAQAAMNMPVDYVAIGPIFATSSKVNHEPPVDLEGLCQVKSAANKPLVAIGGITLQNCSAVLSAGADAVAVIQDIWGSTKSPIERTHLFIEQIRA
jgi:thiamine-phosphate pyrophosphorylase